MTTKVVIACPDNSVHNANAWLEKMVDGAWVRSAEPVVIAPRTTAEPIYLDGKTRIVIEEEARATVQPV